MKQFTYIRIDSMWGKPKNSRFFNCPCFIVYANTLREADAQFKEAFGMNISKLMHISVRWIEVGHVNHV